MFLSVFDIFKVGVGPSSSHTMGPMTAAARFLEALRGADLAATPVAGLQATLHGSLAFTGKGHATDRAVILGLIGYLPDTLDPDAAEKLEGRSASHQADLAARPGIARLRPGGRSGLRLRRALARPCQRPGAARPRCRRPEHPGADLLFDRRRLCRHGRGADGPEPGRQKQPARGQDRKRLSLIPSRPPKRCWPWGATAASASPR